jgi:protocatechuate 3,4-dioxygenase beta subunit
MWTRRALIQAVPTGFGVYAFGGCRREDPEADADTANRPDPATDPETGVEPTAPVGSETAIPSEACEETTGDIEGPFYRADAPERADIVRAGDTGRALTLSGRVLAGDGCTPPPNAVVDVWQADPMGVYDNATDAMDYRARVVCDADGRWSLRTFEPGRYLNGAQYRPAHLHVKVWVDGVERLTTQLYFPGDPYNDVDPWYDPQREVLATGDGTATYDLVV